mmetsp:Transcript_16286/g.30833  ORF Transcript_16286/g.30833 Transcript_16286/m.30833 type:complete len:337 (-) Transcript_16286:667-1677(-)
MFPSPKSTPLQQEEIAGSLLFVPELCDFCNGSKIPAPCRHICTVEVTADRRGRLHPATKDMICSLVTCGECQAEDNDSPVNVCLMHWKLKTNVAVGTQENGNKSSATPPVFPHVSWETVRDDMSCYIDQNRRARNKASRSGESSLQYKELNEAATMLFELYESKIEYFEIKLKRKADGIMTIMGWIVDKRERDIVAFKSVSKDNVPRDEFFTAIKEWEKNSDDAVYMMDQASILIEAFSVWGRNESKVKPNGPNDFVRLIAIMLHPNNRDNMDIINDERKMRVDLDDPSRSKNAIFDHYATQMISDDVYCHPRRWVKIPTENLENKQMIDPNDSNV